MAQIQAQHQIPSAVSNGVAPPSAGGVVAPVGGVSNQLPPTSLYVGDLESNVSDSQLFDLFNQIGPVVSVRVCRDMSTRRSLGYGYVNYANAQDAARAIEHLNFTPVNNKEIRIMYSHRDPSLRKSGTGNIFIKNLDKSIDNKALCETFSTFGNILSCKIATDATGQSKGYGFVQYSTEEAAQTAIDKLNGMLMNDKQVSVMPFLRKQDRESTTKSKFNNVYVKNLSESTTDDDLKEIFGEFGDITSAVVMKDSDGKSKCFGFVNFDRPDDAAKAVESLNGKKFGEKEWYVGKAQKKTEREQELKTKVKEAVDKYQGLNLYVKNLDDSIDDLKLREMFAEFGAIRSCKVMCDPSGISKGSGFVSFSSPEEASRALSALNGKMVVSKPLYVALAQRKEERRARLQAQFAQMQPVPIPVSPSIGHRVPVYPGQQVFYGQAPPPPVFGYPQMRPVYMQGGRRSVPPTMHHHPRGRTLRFPSLATALANASPEHQRSMLGESLFPLVSQLELVQAAKVTGMLLEMDQTEVLHLIESPEALKAKVAEAIQVLRNNGHHHHHPGNGNLSDHLSSLSLSDNHVSS